MSDRSEIKYFVIAGERSGDLHGGNLVRELRAQDPSCSIEGYGGDYMEEAGARIVSHYREGAFMGLWEVIRNLGKIRSRMAHCRKAIVEFDPDVLILIDYPGFNLRMAKFAHRCGIKVAYYIAPKIWAWNQGRIKQIKNHVDEMYSILPFEVDYFDSLGYSVIYVGNPLVEFIQKFNYEKLDGITERRNIAFLPGSRRQEVLGSVQAIEDLAGQRPDLHFWVAAVDNLPLELYQNLHPLKNVTVLIDRTYDILKLADAAIVTSGTATLETLLLGCPQVVCYRTSPLTYHIGKRLIRVPFISLVNLIAGKEVVRELIQEEYNTRNVIQEMDRLLEKGSYRSEMLENYKKVKEIIGTHSTAQLTAASIIRLSGT